MANNLFNLGGKIIVLSGGMGLLGKQFTFALVNSGARVAVLDVITEETLVKSNFGELINEDRVIVLECDITQRESIERALKNIFEHWHQTPYGLINNAAIDSPPDASVDENGPFETIAESSWDKVMEVNSKGVFLLSQVIGGAMANNGEGSIVNISSIYGLVSPNQNIYKYRRKKGEEFYKPAAYSASKSSLLNFTRYLATYWAKHGVRVNSLVLGGVYNSQDDEFLDNYCELIPIGRMANEDEYNGSIVFLMSEASSYMTGSMMVVDGGWTAW